MDKCKKKLQLSERRCNRVRRKLLSRSGIRLSVHATGKHIYAQLIDDAKAITLAAASSCDPDCVGNLPSGGNITAAEQVGKIIGTRALAIGISSAIFDRGARRFHGRVAAVANAAKMAGLQL